MKYVVLSGTKKKIYHRTGSSQLGLFIICDPHLTIGGATDGLNDKISDKPPRGHKLCGNCKRCAHVQKKARRED